MFCPKCGEKIRENLKFCPKCGSEINSEKIKKVEESRSQTVAQIQEGQFVKEVKYAEFWDRFFAFIIDLLIINAIGWPISIFLPIPKWSWGIPFDLPYNDLINWLIGFVYFFLLEAYNKGQTIGKMALGLRAVDEESLAIATPDKYAINNLLRGTGFQIFDFIIGILANSGDEKKRLRIMQNISKTVVIKVK